MLFFVLDVKLKRGSTFFFKKKIDLCLAISMESSRRDLWNDMAEHRPILKNNQNTHLPFTPKRGVELPKAGALISLC